MLVLILSMGLLSVAPGDAFQPAETGAPWLAARIEDLSAITADVALSIRSSLASPQGAVGGRAITLSSAPAGGVMALSADTGRSSAVQAATSLAVRLVMSQPGATK